MTELQEIVNRARGVHGAIAGYLAESRDVPDGHELVAVASKDWRLASGKRCRAGAGPGHHACGRPSVAELKRGSKQYPSWWAYCLDHLYANWIEDGQVWCWILREKVNDGA